MTRDEMWRPPTHAEVVCAGLKGMDNCTLGLAYDRALAVSREFDPAREAWLAEHEEKEKPRIIATPEQAKLFEKMKAEADARRARIIELESAQQQVAPSLVLTATGLISMEEALKQANKLIAELEAQLALAADNDACAQLNWRRKTST